MVIKTNQQQKVTLKETQVVISVFEHCFNRQTNVQYRAMSLQLPSRTPNTTSLTDTLHPCPPSQTQRRTLHQANSTNPSTENDSRITHTTDVTGTSRPNAASGKYTNAKLSAAAVRVVQF